MAEDRIPERLRAKVSRAAGNRCEYCRMPESYSPYPGTRSITSFRSATAARRVPEPRAFLPGVQQSEGDADIYGQPDSVRRSACFTPARIAGVITSPGAEIS